MPEHANGDSRPTTVTRVGLWMSLSVLAAGALVLAILFYQMVRPLAVPLFFAAVVAMLVQPIHRCINGWPQVPAWLSAAVVTLCSLVVIVGPLVAITHLGLDKLHSALAGLDARGRAAAADARVSSVTEGQLDTLLIRVSESLGVESERVRTAIVGSGRDLEQTFFARSLDVLGSIPRILLSIILFAVAVFFLLKDGPRVARSWDELTPLRPGHDQAIRNEFGSVFRSVVWGTLAAALAQALAFAVGFFLINAVFGLGVGAWTFGLALLTLICATIPFLGAVSVWAPTAVVLFLLGDRAAAVTLAVYGGLVISQVDTVIRVWVLKGAARLHPLLALVCVFGGMLYFGILGVFLGPMIGALFVALLRILKKEAIDLSFAEGRRGLPASAIPAAQEPR